MILMLLRHLNFPKSIPDVAMVYLNNK